MKTAAMILIILGAHFYAAESAAKMPNIPKEIKSGINKIIHDAKRDCIFGVESVKMYFYNGEVSHKAVKEEEVCDLKGLLKKIVFISHGFTSSANSFIELANSFVKENCTVFILDWSDAACTHGIPILKFLEYPFAVRNTREIGRYMANYIISVMKCNVSRDNILLVGHSLGAHVCGFAAKQIKNSGWGTMPRLIAADPAAPFFQYNSPDQKLDKMDSEYVAVLHTSNLGLPYHTGHIDLVFNKGYIQPGCFDIACSHTRSVEYIIQMLKLENCGFVGFPTSNNSYLGLMGQMKRAPEKQKCQSDAIDCIFIDKSILENNYNKKGEYYVFVDKYPYCTQKKFDYQ